MAPQTLGFIPRRILIPINGGPTDTEAVRLGCRLAKRGQAKVMVLTVLEVRRGLPLGATRDDEADAAEKLLESAEKVAQEHDVEVETELLQAREAGPAIVEEIQVWRADLTVVGMPWRMRFGEFYMGKTVPFLLAHAPCRTLLFREPPE